MERNELVAIIMMVHSDESCSYIEPIGDEKTKYLVPVDQYPEVILDLVLGGIGAKLSDEKRENCLKDLRENGEIKLELFSRFGFTHYIRVERSEENGVIKFVWDEDDGTYLWHECCVVICKRKDVRFLPAVQFCCGEGGIYIHLRAFCPCLEDFDEAVKYWKEDINTFEPLTKPFHVPKNYPYDDPSDNIPESPDKAKYRYITSTLLIDSKEHFENSEWYQKNQSALKYFEDQDFFWKTFNPSVDIQIEKIAKEQFKELVETMEKEALINRYCELSLNNVHVEIKEQMMVPDDILQTKGRERDE